MDYSLSEILHQIIETRDILQIYHWNTRSYPRHKASDELIQNLTSHMDKFVESYLGVNNQIQVTINKKITVKSYDDSQISSRLIQLSDYLRDLTLKSRDKSYLRKPNAPKMTTDLLNIRDEILEDIHNTLYLFMLR